MARCRVACPWLKITVIHWLSQFYSLLILFAMLSSLFSEIRPDTRPISSRLRVGRGSNEGGQGHYEEGRELYCDWAGAVVIKNRFFGWFCIIIIFALRSSFLRKDTASYSYRVAWQATKKNCVLIIKLLIDCVLIIKLLIDNSFVAGVGAMTDAMTALKRQNAWISVYFICTRNCTFWSFRNEIKCIEPTPFESPRKAL